MMTLCSTIDVTGLLWRWKRWIEGIDVGSSIEDTFESTHYCIFNAISSARLLRVFQTYCFVWRVRRKWKLFNVAYRLKRYVLRCRLLRKDSIYNEANGALHIIQMVVVGSNDCHSAKCTRRWYVVAGSRRCGASCWSCQDNVKQEALPGFPLHLVSCRRQGVMGRQRNFGVRYK